MQKEISAVYVTVPSMEAAEKLTQMVLEKRLAGCVNIFPGISSIYSWQGQIERSEEIALLIKTRASLVPELISAVKAEHSYSTPCIFEVRLDNVEAGYADWLFGETQEK